MGADIAAREQSSKSHATESKQLGFGGGVVDDVKARWPFYCNDWREGMTSKMLAPSTYIFFASVIPAIAFGQQFVTETHGAFNGTHVLASTAICGTIQAVLGGQPLLIVGVAEPIVIIYTFMYEISHEYSIPFYAWTSWTCIWASAFIFLLSLTNCCQLINKFTRFSGETFGMLIAILFLQAAIKGLKHEFALEDTERGWRLFNGAWGIILAFGLTGTTIVSSTARKWPFFNGFVRALLADYAGPLMVLAWTLVSYIPRNTVSTVPSRVEIPDTLEGSETWTTIGKLGDCTGGQIAMAAVPGLIITVLFFFDHNVSAQLAQVKEFSLLKPSAYHYDFALLAFMTLLCGLLGLPPVNGVLPQAPMHTRSLVQLKATPKTPNQSRKQLADRTPARTPARSKGKEATSEHDIELAVSTLNPGDVSHVTFVIEETEVEESLVPIEVREQRVSPLLQSLLCGLCLFLAPLLRCIPNSVLWGYFMVMSIESLPGCQFWERLLLLGCDKHRLRRAIETGHHLKFLETVSLRTITLFTLMQLGVLLVTWAVCVWTGIVGIVFPVLIMALVPVRHSVLPRMFNHDDLQELDFVDYVEVDDGTILDKDRADAEFGECAKLTDPADIMEEEIHGTHGSFYPSFAHHMKKRLKSIPKDSSDGMSSGLVSVSGTT